MTRPYIWHLVKSMRKGPEKDILEIKESIDSILDFAYACHGAVDHDIAKNSLFFTEIVRFGYLYSEHFTYNQTRRDSSLNYIMFSRDPRHDYYIANFPLGEQFASIPFAVKFIERSEPLPKSLGLNQRALSNYFLDRTKGVLKSEGYAG